MTTTEKKMHIKALSNKDTIVTVQKIIVAKLNLYLLIRFLKKDRNNIRLLIEICYRVTSL
jgi:hypothetical protein